MISARVALAVATAMAVTTGLPAAVHAEEAPVLDRTGYDVAMLCTVTNLRASSQRESVGDEEGAAQYQEQADTALRVALGYGEVLGIATVEVERDIAAMQEREVPKMIEDMDYMLRAVGTCKAYELM